MISSSATPAAKSLYLQFHGRIIDSLGIQMYQSPVAAIAELIANAWDADAKNVSITLPDAVGAGVEIYIRDNGVGMTFSDCQDRYLNVGRDRRVEGKRTAGGRPVLGRKGIGKFAGFGIAGVVEIDSISAVSGEHTAFKLDLSKLRSDEFVGQEKRKIEVLIAEGPDQARTASAGTVVRLKNLALSRRPTVEAFAHSMARRFVLARAASDFTIEINGQPIPKDVDPIGNKIEFVFPGDYREPEKPVGLRIDGGWGEETLPDGNTIKWQVQFAEKPIAEEDFRGIAVYCGIKLAQTPFFFQLSGGLAGQHGQVYMTGRVIADYLDQMGADVITTERQRINWENETAAVLLEWGSTRVKSLLSLWKDRRAEERVKELDSRIAVFAQRIARLPSSEARIVKAALRKLAAVETIGSSQFAELATALLTAWEGGRLRGIIEDMARVTEMEPGVLLGVLIEENVLTALHLAEVVKAKVSVIAGLRERILVRALENDIRDYIAKHPWLISPEWETFRTETSLDVFLREARAEAGIDDDDEAWRGRMDLVLRSSGHLAVLEFMRPGLTADRDHFNRFMHYVQVLRDRLKGSSTAAGIQRISGLVVADKLSRRTGNLELIEILRQNDMLCEEWLVLLSKAEASWREFLEVVVSRAPEDPRLKALGQLTPATGNGIAAG